MICNLLLYYFLNQFPNYSLSSGPDDNDSDDIEEDYDKGYSELNNEIDGQVSIYKSNLDIPITK